ncbi:hypothetical protein cyc_07869 [Cyclospora cayetanensis]|uniref:Uncharacterized protein n=1 Tax=Cyclospora cayetanensis TaxID=88456 RepID=A0A1D3CS59_9EIME|nr:hypothetical protein cyc_07869 [Cyclospora cayetanensis]
MRAKSERVYKPGAKEEWRVVYWIYPQERVKNNRKQVSFSSLKYGDSTAQLKAWAVIRFINHFGCVPEDIKNPPLSLPPCCASCYPHCLKEHVPGCNNCIDPPTDRHFLGIPPSAGAAPAGSAIGTPCRLRPLAALEGRSSAADGAGDDASEEAYGGLLHGAAAAAAEQQQQQHSRDGARLPLAAGTPPSSWLEEAAAAAAAASAAARQSLHTQQRHHTLQKDLQLRASPADTTLLSEASPELGILSATGCSSSISSRFEFLAAQANNAKGASSSSASFLKGSSPHATVAFQPLPPAAVGAAPSLASESFFAAAQELSSTGGVRGGSASGRLISAAYAGVLAEMRGDGISQRNAAGETTASAAASLEGMQDNPPPAKRSRTEESLLAELQLQHQLATAAQQRHLQDGAGETTALRHAGERVSSSCSSGAAAVGDGSNNSNSSAPALVSMGFLLRRVGAWKRLQRKWRLRRKWHPQQQGAATSMQRASKAVGVGEASTRVP